MSNQQITLEGLLVALSLMVGIPTATLGDTVTEQTSGVAGNATSGSLPQTGCDAWRKAAVISLKGITEDDGIKGSFSLILDTRTGRYVTHSDYGIYKDADGFDGRKAWDQDWSGGSHFKDSAAAQAISTSRAWLLRRGWCSLLANSASIFRLPDGVDSGVSVTVWKAAPPGGLPLVLRFESNTGRLIQSEIEVSGAPRTVQYSDWRDIGHGLLIAFNEQHGRVTDASLSTIKLESAIASPSLVAAGTFAKPSQPHDYRITGNTLSTTVPYEDDGIARIFVPVFIDGAGPFIFEIDSGSSDFVLSRDAAELLHLSAAGNFSTEGTGPEVEHSGIGQTRELRIGAATIRNQVVTVLPMSSSSANRGDRPARAGILGLPLFERFALALDRSRKTLTLTPLEQFHVKPQGVLVPIRFTGSAPIAAGSFNGIAGYFELDTGDASPAMVFGYWAQEHELAEQLSRGIKVRNHGVGGYFETTHSRGDFRLGSLRLDHQVVMYTGAVEQGYLASRTQAGVIGESSLYRYNMTYDYKDELVWIDPSPRVLERPYDRAGLGLTKDSTETFAVTRVVPGSPAADAAIKVGDKILSINSKPVARMAATDASAVFTGPVGSDIELIVSSKDSADQTHLVLRLKELLP